MEYTSGQLSPAVPIFVDNKSEGGRKVTLPRTGSEPGAFSEPR